MKVATVRLDEPLTVAGSVPAVETGPTCNGYLRIGAFGNGLPVTLPTFSDGIFTPPPDMRITPSR